MLTEKNLEHSADLELEGFRYESTDETVVKLLTPEYAEAEDQPKAEQVEYEEAIPISEDDLEEHRHHCSECPLRKEYMEKHILTKHHNSMYRCDICGQLLKAMFIKAHMEGNHPPLIASVRPVAESKFERKMLFCSLCKYSSKSKYVIRRHMVSQHLTELEEENSIINEIEEFEFIPHAEDLQKTPANIQFELISEEEDAYLEEGEVEDEVIELEEIEQANEGSDDIALSNAVKEEDPDNIQQPIEEFENIPHAEDLQKDPANIQFELTSEEEDAYLKEGEVEDEVIELEEIEQANEGSDDIALSNAVKEEDPDNIQQPIEEFENIPHAEDLQKDPANIQFELTSEEEDAYLKEGEVEDEVIELEEIEQANEGSDDIALSNPIEEFKNIHHAEDLQKDPHNIQPKEFEVASEEEEVANVEAKEEVIELDEISLTCTSNEDIYDIHQPLVKDEIHIEDTDSPEIETVEDIFAVDAACSSNEQRQSKQERGLTYDQAQRRWYCQQCSYSGKSRHYAVSHFEHVHRGVPKKKMQCEICSYESGSWRYFNEHINRKHRTEPRPAILPDEGIPCKQQGCDYKAPSVDELSRHIARHLQTSIQEMMKYKCEECHFATVSKAVLKKHKCMPVRLFECYGCRFKCDMRINLYQHIYKCHGYTYSKKKGYRCRKCGCAAKGKTWMKRHYAKCSEK
ncbi:unnamed protein product [Acanthoscelides obtectus]|uniref:C2H2-type domain-containing protein n=1 Tax=Acanthoscelides obtectus TaxID=200917 RepID=A0A9P0PR27_ACAOB|nr:unnamed protein product [Acanthoscelides obtectus]CAK1626581.1 hypothetical protein AOBTE_LOCUS3950 [Acanthoscelides obtectus]